MRVQLTKPHTHAGVEYQPHAILTVSEPVGDWLLEHADAVIHDEPPEPSGTVTLSAPPQRHRKRPQHHTEETYHGK